MSDEIEGTMSDEELAQKWERSADLEEEMRGYVVAAILRCCAAELRLRRPETKEEFLSRLTRESKSLASRFLVLDTFAPPHESDS